MKKMLSILLCLALMLSLAACSNTPDPTEPSTEAPTTQPTEPPTEPPLTVADVYANVVNAMNDAEATAMKMELSFGVSYTEGEGEDAVETEISYDMLMDTVVSQNPCSGYNLTSISMGTDGFNMDIDVEVYTLVEGEHVVSYAKTFGAWFREDYGMAVEEYLASAEAMLVDVESIWTGGEMPADMTLDENTQNLNGTEVYVLRATNVISGIEDALIEMGVEMEPGQAEISLPAVYYVDAQSFTILRVVGNMQPMMDLLADTMSQSILGTDAESSGLEITISDAVYDLGYGQQDVPALPQEALDYIANDESSSGGGEILPVEGQATDMGNGTFVLPCGSEALTIACPLGWSGEVYDYNNIWIYNEDQSLYGDFYYRTTYTEEDILAQLRQAEADLKDWDIFISSGEGPAFEGYTTRAVLGEGESYCYAWKTMGNGYLVVILADYTDAPDFETMLQDLLSLVTPYTGEFMAYNGAVALDDGSFSLRCGSQKVIITCPEGWFGAVYSESNIWTCNSDETIYGDFYYLDSYTAEDVMEYWNQYDVDQMKTDKLFISLEDGPAIEGCTTLTLQAEGISYYYAYCPIGNGCLVLQVSDWDGGNDAAELLPMLMAGVTYE